MTYLSEDPTYLAGGLGVLALVFLVALRVTQQGKFLMGALACLGLAGVVLLVERLWVTDSERIEQVVYDLRAAVEASDGDGVVKHLTSDVQYAPGSAVKFLKGTPLSGALTRTFIKTTLSNAKFDFVRITHLETSAKPQSRRGTAEFRVLASGSMQSSVNVLNFGTTGSSWSLGLRETSPKVWQVDRISPTSIPADAQSVMPVSGPLR